MRFSSGKIWFERFDLCKKTFCNSDHCWSIFNVFRARICAWYSPKGVYQEILSYFWGAGSVLDNLVPADYIIWYHPCCQKYIPTVQWILTEMETPTCCTVTLHPWLDPAKQALLCHIWINRFPWWGRQLQRKLSVFGTEYKEKWTIVIYSIWSFTSSGISIHTWYLFVLYATTFFASTPKSAQICYQKLPCGV